MTQRTHRSVLPGRSNKRPVFSKAAKQASLRISGRKAVLLLALLLLLLLMQTATIVLILERPDTRCPENGIPENAVPDAGHVAATDKVPGPYAGRNIVPSASPIPAGNFGMPPQDRTNKSDEFSRFPDKKVDKSANNAHRQAVRTNDVRHSMNPGRMPETAYAAGQVQGEALAQPQGSTPSASSAAPVSAPDFMTRPVMPLDTPAPRSATHVPDAVERQANSPARPSSGPYSQPYSQSLSHSQSRQHTVAPHSQSHRNTTIENPGPSPDVPLDVPLAGLDAARLLELMQAHPLERADNPERPLAFPARQRLLASGDLPNVRLSMVGEKDGARSEGSPGQAGALPDSVLFPSLTERSLERALSRISRARALDRDMVDELLARVPGIAASTAPDGASAPDGTANPAAPAPRTALLVFTEPTCPHCRTALRLLSRLEERLAFPVLLLPIGESRASLDLHARAGATLTDMEASQVGEWLGAATGALCAIEGTNAPRVPTFVWVMDGDVRVSTLTRSELFVLAASLNARELALQTELQTGRKGNEFPHNGNAIDKREP